MLKQGTVDQVRNQEIPRENSHIVITMCYYPRGIKKEWRDEFHSSLAPDRALFKEWKELEKTVGHDEAFTKSNYEARFNLTPLAIYHLKQYSESDKDVFFICQCKVGERCHREMLMLASKIKFAAKVDQIFHPYPIFEKRIPELDLKLKLW